MAEQALTAVIRGAYIQGTPTHPVNSLVRTVRPDGISKSQVSRLREDINQCVNRFLDWLIKADRP